MLIVPKLETAKGRIMVGIALSPEQVRSAPVEVRRWIEHEIAVSFGFAPQTEAAAPAPKHLVGCTLEQAAAIYTAICGMLPAVNVFFELGREGQATGQEGVEVHQLADMLRHTRLQGLDQLATCLSLIDETIRQIRRDSSATLCALDRRGYALIATETRENISTLWTQLLGGAGTLQPAGEAGPGRPPASAEYRRAPGVNDAEPTPRSDGPRPR